MDHFSIAHPNQATSMYAIRRNGTSICWTNDKETAELVKGALEESQKSKQSRIDDSENT